MKKYVKTHSWGATTFYNAYIVCDHHIRSFSAYEGMARVMQEELGIDPDDIECGTVFHEDAQFDWPSIAIHASLGEPCPDRKDWIHLEPEAPIPGGYFV